MTNPSLEAFEEGLDDLLNTTVNLGSRNRASQKLYVRKARQAIMQQARELVAGAEAQSQEAYTKYMCDNMVAHDNDSLTDFMELHVPEQYYQKRLAAIDPTTKGQDDE